MTAPSNPAASWPRSPYTVRVIDRTSMDPLFQAIAEHGFTLVGPVLRNHAIVLDELTSVDDLPAGWTDVQERGTYRLEKRADGALFGYTAGPHSFKKYLFPPETRLWCGERSGRDFEPDPPPDDPRRYAFIGVRACDLHAILIQDAVFLRGRYADPLYRSRRERVLVVAVNCTEAGGTCFCVSMGTGPKATKGFDLALTEITENGDHFFTVETGSERGREIIDAVPHRRAGASEESAASAAWNRAAARMGRALDTSSIKSLFYENYEHPRWDAVEKRCLTCANCTMVCPTCFCSTVEDRTDLSGTAVERWRRWDSCFSIDFSYIVGGSIRQTVRSRYRQWITHKLATWIDQFGTSGCVGCGRCITWCPVGIDITEEADALRGEAPEGRTAGTNTQTEKGDL